VKPSRVYLTGALHEMGIGIDPTTLVIQHFSVTTLTTTDKKDEVMA
jgi:hypothetical protein